MKSYSNWVPTAFCAALVLTGMVTHFVYYPAEWPISFFAFLPLCFFFVGANTTALNREVRDLREQVSRMQAVAKRDALTITDR